MSLSEWTTAKKVTSISALFGFFLTFWPLTVPAIINAYFAKYRVYLRHQWNKILIFSFIILFCYWSIGNLLIAQNTQYLTDRILIRLRGFCYPGNLYDNLPLLVITEIKVGNQHAIISISSRSSPHAR